MPTEDQKKDTDRLERYIVRESLISIMNNTKWKELRNLILNNFSFSPKYRVKCLRQPGANECYWETDWQHHLPSPYKVIEWVDIDPIQYHHLGGLVDDIREDKTEELSCLLRAKSIPFEVEGIYLRIYGYRRSPAA